MREKGGGTKGWASPAVCRQVPDKAPPGPGPTSAARRQGDPAPASLHLRPPGPGGSCSSCRSIPAPSSGGPCSSCPAFLLRPQEALVPAAAAFLLRPPGLHSALTSSETPSLNTDSRPSGSPCRTLPHTCGPRPAGTLSRLIHTHTPSRQNTTWAGTRALNTCVLKECMTY